MWFNWLFHGAMSPNLKTRQNASGCPHGGNYGGRPNILPFSPILDSTDAKSSPEVGSADAPLAKLCPKLADFDARAARDCGKFFRSGQREIRGIAAFGNPAGRNAAIDRDLFVQIVCRTRRNCGRPAGIVEAGWRSHGKTAKDRHRSLYGVAMSHQRTSCRGSRIFQMGKQGAAISGCGGVGGNVIGAESVQGHSGD